MLKPIHPNLQPALLPQHDLPPQMRPRDHTRLRQMKRRDHHGRKVRRLRHVVLHDVDLDRAAGGIPGVRDLEAGGGVAPEGDGFETGVVEGDLLEGGFAGEEGRGV